MTELVYNL